MPGENPSQPRFRLPHLGWLTLAAVLLIVAAAGLAIWLPYYREVQIARQIEAWGGEVTWSFAQEPGWLGRVVPPGLRYLPVFHRIWWIDLRGAGSDESLFRLSELRNVHFLELSNSPITDSGLAHLRPLNRLVALDLSGTRASSVGLQHLAGTATLKVLSLSNTPLDDSALVHLRGLTNLSTLELCGTAIDGTGFARLNHLPLTDLDLGGTRVTDDGLAAISRCASLRCLGLGGTLVSDAGLVHLQALPELETLDLSGCQEGLSAIDRICQSVGSGYLRLRRTFHENGQPFVRYDLFWSEPGDAHITDSGLAHVRELRRLRTLYLDGRGVSAPGLSQLSPLTQLETLSLQGTRITRGAIRQTKTALPQCRFEL